MHDPLAGQKGARKEIRPLLIFVVFLIAIFLVFVHPHTDDFDLSNRECEELNRFWKSSAQADFRFTDDWNPGSFSCPSAESSFVRALQFISRLEEPINEKQPTASYHAWAVALKPTFSNQILFGLAGRTVFEERRIDISPMILNKHNWVKTAGVIVHELRHLEQGINTHVPCAREPSKSCDTRLDADPATAGAYSYNMMFFHHVRNSPHATRYEKKLARREMENILASRFNRVEDQDYSRYGLEKPSL